MTTRAPDAILAADVASVVEEIAARSGKRVGAIALRANATAAGKVLAAIEIDDGSGIVMLDGGRELVPLEVKTATARSLRDRSGVYASARVERDLGAGGALAWTIALGETLGDATHAGATPAAGDADLRAALFSAEAFAAERPARRMRSLLDDPRTSVTVTYDGPALGQDDLDAYLAVLGLARACDATGRMRFVTEALAKRYGKAVDPDAVAASLVRLCDGTIRLQSRTYETTGHLIDYAARSSDRWQVTVAPEFASLFDPFGYADALAVRTPLGSPLAKWAHARAFALRADVTFTMLELAHVIAMSPGSELDATVRRAFDEIVRLGAPFATWSIDGDRVVLRLV